MRYPRGSGTGAAVQADLSTLPIGKGEVRRESGVARGRRVAILAFGSMVIAAQAAAEALDATLVNMRFVKPLDRELVEHVARTHDALVTIEESAVSGGAGAGVLELLAELGIACPALLLGLPDRFIDHGEIAKLHTSIGLDPAGIEASIRSRFADLLSAPGDRAGRIKSVA
ncbi:MAG: transketolase C-terminal domain-containing protein [Burkholderiaceae bacterium]|nr:transketolase C-terminal domain-containing protein [Burkholderiaceae bacterium]